MQLTKQTPRPIRNLPEHDANLAQLGNPSACARIPKKRSRKTDIGSPPEQATPKKPPLPQTLPRDAPPCGHHVDLASLLGRAPQVLPLGGPREAGVLLVRRHRLHGSRHPPRRPSHQVPPGRCRRPRNSHDIPECVAPRFPFPPHWTRRIESRSPSY